MIIVPEAACPDLLDMEAAFEAVEQVFAAMARGEAYNFPVVREAIGHADALYGFKGGFDRAGATLGVKAGGYWPHNLETKNLTNHQSTVYLFDPDTGRPTACVGGNYLTAARTAASSAVSIKHLARPDARVLGMVGAGHQSAFQMRAALGQRGFERVIGWNLHPEMLSRLADTAAEAGLPFEAVDLDRLGAEADVIITITSSFAPILMAAQVKPGTHLACMGTDTKGKQEVEAALLAKATVFTDEVAQSVTIGEAQHAVADGLIPETAITQIGAVITGSHPGRRSAEEITLFDGTGVGLQDLAVAAAVVRLAKAAGKAVEVEIDRMQVPVRLAAMLTLLCLAAGAARADAMADKLCPILQSVAASNASASLPELVQAQLVMQVADAYGYDHDALQAVLDAADAATTAACPAVRDAILAATKQPSLTAAMR